EVDPAGDDQRQRRHPELGDGRITRLVHAVAILVMMISVAICIAPRTPAEYMKRFISFSITAGFGRRFLSSVSTAMFAGSSSPSAITDITPTTMKLATTQPCTGEEVWFVPRLVASCQPAASVIVTTVGMITTIFGISLVMNSIR